MKLKKTTSTFSKDSLYGWCMFDFANSIPTVIGGIYFAKWYTEDIGAGSVLFNLLFFVSSLIIVLSGHLIGNRIDKDGYKIWIRLSSAISIIATILLFVFSQLLAKSYQVYLSFLLFLFFLFGYQVSRICHNYYLRAIIPENLQTKMSGYGTAANWAGSIVGIIITVPITSSYPGIRGHELTFLAAAIGYLTFAPIALVLMFRSNRITIASLSNENIGHKTLKSIIAATGLLLFVYLILFDVMATVQRNLPPFLTIVLRVSDNIQAFGFLLILFSALVGGIISAKIVSFKNSLFWLKSSSLSLCLAIVLITIEGYLNLWIAFIIAGVSYGILESAIRVNFMGTFSSSTAGKNFGILAVVERTSGVIGPLIWISPFLLYDNEIKSYNTSMLLMAALALIGFVLLKSKNINMTDKI